LAENDLSSRQKPTQYDILHVVTRCAGRMCLIPIGYQVTVVG